MNGALQTVTSYGRNGSSARVRVFDWLDFLGLRAESHTYLGGSDNSVRSLASKFPSILAAESNLRSLVDNVADSSLLMSRRASPFSRGGIEEQLLRGAKHSVYDFDDAINLARPDAIGRLFRPDVQWRKAVEAAHTVIAGNDWLGEAASQHSNSVVVIPSCVEPAMYTEKKEYGTSPTPRAVWLGSPATERYLRKIQSALLMANKTTGLRLTVISAGDDDLGVLGAMVDRVKWTLDTFPGHLASADFGIMPLDNEPWARGKCAYKLLQYGAAGLPMIGDPVGANARVLRLAGGTAPTSTDEWTDALVGMARMDATDAAKSGGAAREAVIRHYSFGAWRSEWLAALRLDKAA